MPGGAGPINVLVVDDSAVVREVMARLLSPRHGFAVTTASDPVIAASKMRLARPDVIVLDLEMPRMDGLTFLRHLMREDPIPVVVCSGLAQAGTDAAVRALAEGAVEVVAKPRLGVAAFLEESSEALRTAVRAAAHARVWRRDASPSPAAIPAVRSSGAAPLAITTDKLVVIGASTGGTEALRQVLAALPPDAPGLVIAQHMPAAYTAAFARQLDAVCRIHVKEAESGDRVIPGRALIAPGNRHTEIGRTGAHYVALLSDGPPTSGHRPSVDVLFRSAARAAGRNAVGVILTGMGHDGADGLLAMRDAGAATLAQDEASCVVFGMPKEAIARGAAGSVVPLRGMAAAVMAAAGA